MKKIEKTTIERLLANVEKPARYIPCELNVITKTDPFFRMAISYPDMYEIGMANHGIKILYEIINGLDDVACERVFAVSADFAETLLSNNVPLYTLESFTPLCDVDLLGFNLAYEMLYTSVLQIIDLGRIPLKSCDRDDTHPIIIAGGEASANPAPMSLFIDAFFIGEGEEALQEIVELLYKMKKAGSSRTEKLSALSKISGVFVPSLYSVKETAEGFTYFEGIPVSRRKFCGERLKDPAAPIVPSIRISQERAVVETTRGCFNLCKFCFSGYNNLPYRKYDEQDIADKAMKVLAMTGYDDIAFLSLSISDYPKIINLLNLLMPKFNEMGVSINLPSLKVDKKTLPVIKTISDVRKSSLTFAIETAGTDMRKIIHKRIHNNELIEILTEVINNGWKKIKLYFMLGLPGYEDHDEVNNTIELLHTINNIRRNRVEINVAISPFVPKPHTPFQWEKMAEPQYFYDSIREIKKRVPKNVSVKFHNIDSIVIEAVLARGDTKISDVILSAYQKGCRLDSWDEFFKKDLWYKSLEENIPDWKKYISVRDNDFVFPWNVINSVNPALIKNKKEKILSDAELSSLKTEYDTKLDFEKINSGFEKFKVKYNTAVVYRGMYEKKGYAKYISHLDLIEVLKRTMRMAGMPLSYTQGFNKREIISFGYPLPLGTESASEEFEFACYQRIDIDETIRKCNEHCIDGVKILSITESKHTSSIMAEIKSFTYEIFVQDDSANINTIGIFELLNNTSHLMKTDKSGNTKQYNFSDVVIKQAMVNDKIYATIRSEGITMKINDILKQVSDLPITSYGIIKISNNR